MSANLDTGKIYCSAVHIQLGGTRNRDSTGGAVEFRIDLNNRVGSTEVTAEKVKPTTAEVEFAPEFGVKPRRQFVDEGHPAKFKVSCEGLPRPEVKWCKNEKELLDDSRVKIYQEDGYHFLEINDVTPQDKGNYSCLLNNKHGKVEASAELSVFEKAQTVTKKPVGPSVISPLEDLTTVEGEKRFVLDCSFADATDCSVTWFKDGEEIKPGREFRARFDGRVASLTISRVLDDDSGKYECVVTGPNGEAKTHCSLKVEVSNEKREPPVFVRELHDMEVDNGDKVELVVEVKGSEPIEVFWIHNNREVTPHDTEYHLVNEGNVHKLVVPRVCQQDAGEYVCEAYSDFGDTDTFCRINVREIVLPAPPEFVSSPRLVTAEEGSNAMFTCRVRGQPVPSVTWEKDDIIIRENSHFKMSMHGDEHVLEILDTTKSDVGSYTCRLTNPSGETSHTATLVIKEKSDFRSVLKNRQNLESPGKQNSTELMKSNKGNTQVDFRQVLRQSNKDRTPPGGRIDNKPKHSSVQQVDFRNVLKSRTDKTESVLPSNSSKSEPVLEKFTQRPVETNRPLNMPSNAVPQAPESTLKRVEEPTSSEPVRKKVSNPVSKVISVNKEENSLRNRLNKFENMSKESSSGDNSCVKTLRNSDKIVNKLKTFETKPSNEQQNTPNETFVKPTRDQSVLQRLNKFEQLSGTGDPDPRREIPPLSQKSKSSSDLLEKYSVSVAQNGHGAKSEFRKNEILYKDITPEKSLKSRMERFEKVHDSTPNSAKVENTGKKETMTEAKWITKSNMDFVNIGMTQQLPRFRRELMDKHVKYGNQAVLECEVSSGLVDWSVNGKSIKSSKFFKMEMTHENVVTLTIAEAYSEDEGEYVCTVTNKYGSVSSSCKLVVEASSSLSSRSDIEGAVTIPARLLSVSPASVAVMTGQEVTVKATFTGEPKPEVRWFKGREEIQKGEGIQIENSVDQSVMTISSVVADDAGKYMIAVENHAGRDSLSTSVSVGDVPEPPGQPQANDIMSSSVMLWWCGPPYDGGSQITHYMVQMKKIGDASWTTVTPSCKNTFCQVASLERKTPYYFRVLAANKHGFSSPGEESSKIFTSDQKLSLDYESDDELPFEPRQVQLVPGRKFEDHYEVMDEVGKGKFGYVYQCKDRESGKIWAAKILKCREKEKANVRHEIEIMNELAHPKLMMIWDAFEASRSMTLVMEFVGGGELFERVISDDFELTEGDCVHFMRQICDGVSYIHDRGILHLDLKPENILCISSSTNQVKIIDFGLARRYEEGKSMKVLFGTPEFIAPEVINYDEISFATDMWSLGVICYLLLSGLSPFLGDNDAETLANVTLGDFDFDDESFDDITDNAKDFIRCLLLKMKEKRMLIKQTQQHVWLVQDERRIRNKRLNTDRLKKFMARRKWQKTGTAIRAIGRMASLQRLMSGSSSSSGRERAGSSASDSSNSACCESDIGAQDKQPFPSPSKVHDDAEIGIIKTETSPNSHSRETTLQDVDKKGGNSAGKKKTCSDHNGNIEIHNDYPNNDSKKSDEIIKPYFLKEMLDCEAFTGDVVRFDVRVAGSPVLEFHWLQDEEEVQEDRRHIVDVSHKGQCSLIIRNVTEDDEGEYTCIAVNQQGEISCSAELIVCSLRAL